MKAVVDSDILIDYLQGVTKAKTELAHYSTLLYSVISWMEVMCGATNEQEREAAKQLLDSMTMVELSGEIAARAVAARQQQRLKLPDAIIWATADCEGCILLTRNSKDFSKKDPRVRIPYRI